MLGFVSRKYCSHNEVRLKHPTSLKTIRYSRKILTIQLSKLVLLIAVVSIDNTEQFNSYFNFGLLEVDNNKTPTEVEPNPEVELPPLTT